jgi:archaellum component FlaC
MKSCTGLWIVAPITRAIDDKAAKNLLGNTFKRQLKYDGIYSAVTFICSKTDDISRIEATESLRLGSQMQEIEDRIADANTRRRAFAQDLKAQKDKKKDYIDTIEDIEDQIETYEKLQEKAEDGKTVFAPGAQKRKRSSDTFQSRKKRRRATFSDDETASDVDESGGAAEPEPSSEPLTTEQIESKLNELKSLKKESRREKCKLDEGIRELEAQIDEIEEEIDNLDASSSELCIAGIEDLILHNIVVLLLILN